MQDHKHLTLDHRSFIQTSLHESKDLVVLSIFADILVF